MEAELSLERYYPPTDHNLMMAKFDINGADSADELDEIEQLLAVASRLSCINLNTIDLSADDNQYYRLISACAARRHSMTQ